MAYATQYAPAPVFARIATVFDGLAQRAFKRAEETRVYQELAALTDRELNDIGISRADIRDVAHQAVA